MSANLGSLKFNKSYSYQHLHGLMLVELNKIACLKNLSHTEYRLMGALIGLWNKEHNKAFPTLDLLAKTCHMSKTTITKTLKSLTKQNLIYIVKHTKNNRNNYYLNTDLFLFSLSTTSKTINSTPCNTTHDIKLIKTKTNIDKSSLNDNDLKLTLKQWNVYNYEQIILNYKKETIKDLIDKTKLYNPDNPGAYFLKLFNKYKNINIIDYKQCSNLKKLIEKDYWIHKPSKTLIKIKPEIGNHLLFKYDKETNKVMFLENAIVDDLSKFEPVINPEESDIKVINNLKPSKKEIIDNLLNNNDYKQARYLAKLWKIKLKC